MYKIAMMSLLALPLFAGFFPQTVHTSISKVLDNTVLLESSLPVPGMSGVIIHNYGNDLDAITSRMVQKSSGKVSLLKGTSIHHDKLPTIKTAITSGDKVIGGYLYNNVLLLAPDAQTYAKITSQHTKNWVHPDLFALFLSKVGDATPNKENLEAFSKAYQVGLIYIVGNGTGKLLDPISGKIVGQKALTDLPQKGKVPFFMRFNEIDSGWFGGSAKGNYYQLMDKI